MTETTPSSLLDRYDVAGGSVAGTSHTKPLMPGTTNNQDALWIRRSDNLLVGVVCDGCGSGKRSEFGAMLGVRLITNEILSQFVYDPQIFPEWDLLTECVTNSLEEQLALLIGESDPLLPLDHVDSWRRDQGIIDSLLFTVMGFVMTPEKTWIFGLGDGVWAINGEVNVIPPFPGNAPPYLGYRLIKENKDAYRLRPLAEIPTAEVESLLVGSDGVGDLADLTATTLPGELETVGPLDQFWSPAAVSNQAWIQRRLNLINRYRVSVDWDARKIRHEVGHLPDDTTLIALRRKN
jgi:hypothetical protein